MRIPVKNFGYQSKI